MITPSRGCEEAFAYLNTPERFQISFWKVVDHMKEHTDRITWHFEFY